MDDIDNGEVSFNATAEGSTATYGCVAGYELNGDTTRTCQANGTWSGTEPQCQGKHGSYVITESDLEYNTILLWNYQILAKRSQGGSYKSYFKVPFSFRNIVTNYVFYTTHENNTDTMNLSTIKVYIPYLQSPGNVKRKLTLCYASIPPEVWEEITLSCNKSSLLILLMS